jgi:ribonuclease Z
VEVDVELHSKQSSSFPRSDHMRITFLGTSGSMPTPERGSSSIVIRKDREVIMLDCGEGTQRQMVKAGVGFQRDMRIFITHMHGDHILGLPGLLQSMSLLRREKDLHIYGPVGLIDFVKAFSESIGGPSFPVSIYEIQEPGIVHEGVGYTVEAVKAKHRETAWSYGVFESERPGKFHPIKAKELKIPIGRDWNKLQHGEPVKVDGQTITPDMVSDPPRPGRRIVYSGDTSPTHELTELARGADVLIHESTFMDELGERAEEDGHTTVTQAAELASKAGVTLLILTHISSRYANPDIILEEAKQVFEKVIVAEDLLWIEVPLK